MICIKMLNVLKKILNLAIKKKNKNQRYVMSDNIFSFEKII